MSIYNYCIDIIQCRIKEMKGVLYYENQEKIIGSSALFEHGYMLVYRMWWQFRGRDNESGIYENRWRFGN